MYGNDNPQFFSSSLVIKPLYGLCEANFPPWGARKNRDDSDFPAPSGKDVTK